MLFAHQFQSPASTHLTHLTFQDERLSATFAQNMLMEENVEDEEETDATLGGAIEKGIRSVLGTVGKPAFNPTKLLQPPPPSRGTLRHRTSPPQSEPADDRKMSSTSDREVIIVPNHETLAASDDRFEAVSDYLIFLDY